ncbi:MAG: DUF4142 domain-containing protein [Phycisphaerae bacterium]|nr:DUF4142 domain-containing protein [Phycisphaerae bacterium]
MMSVDAQGVNDLLAQWAERPRLGATQMIAKYGQPQEATSYRMVWHNPGPFKRISVMNIETPHDFPLPHVDYMEHTITYNVPQDKVADLIAFDGSSTINRTAGELSARCDLEGHNVLTLNLDHDIVTGKTTVEGARKAFGEMVDQDIKGKHPAYVEALQFTPDQASRAEFPDSPVIPGSPQRAAVARESDGKGDSEVLATVIAIDLNQVLAASQAQTKKIGQPVKEFAKMLHKVHGAHMVETMQLGQRIGVTPIITSSVEKLQRDGAGALSLLVPLDGDAFAGAYIDAMVRGHENVLTIIDKELTKNASIADVQQHLEAMRDHVAQHLEKAKALQGSMQLNRAR